jgi:hypothetical protein
MTGELHPGGGWLVRLTGIIDETFDKTKLAFGAQDTVVFDLDGVRRITSYGIREWIAAIGALQASYYFIRCRPAVVSQFNMVQSFGGRGQLVSLYAPYACSSCGNEIEVLIDRRHPSAHALAPPTLPCPSCGAAAEFDDIPESFFSYVSAAPPLSLSTLAEAIVDGMPGSLPSGRLTVSKEVHGQVTALWLAGPLDKSAHLKRVADGLEGTVVIVLASIASVNDEGIERFSVLATTPNIDLYLTRVPVSIAASLTRSPKIAARAKVLYVRVLFVCPTCGHRSEIDADAATLKRVIENRVYQLCSTCGVLMKPPAPGDLRETLKLTFAPTPPLLQPYLFGSPEAFLESASGLQPASLRAPSMQATPSSARRPSALTPTPTSQEQHGAASSPFTPSESRQSSPHSSPHSSRQSSPHSSPHSSPTPHSTGAISRRQGEGNAEPGRLSRYEIIRRIGTGGMATVYLGRVVAAGGFERLVAIKIMHPHIADDPNCVAMFLQEARLAARIRHPNVVPTLDIEETPESLMMVMEYIEGLTLSHLVGAFHKYKRKLPLPVALRIMTDVLVGLHAAHELRDPDGTPLDLVHRDVSPHNVIVGLDGLARVTDFGIARVQARVVMSTRRGQIKGKVGYMSPEQIHSYATDRRSDIYATGVVMWEMLAGQRLFKGESEAAVLFSATQGIKQAPVEIDATLPAAVSEACMRALKQDPDERFATAADFAEEIERAAGKAGITFAPGREVTAAVNEAVALRSKKT